MRVSLDRYCAFFALTLLLAAGTVLAGDPEPSTSTSAVERGAYLVRISACNDCHTPFKMGPRGPEPDMSRMLTGHPATLEVPPPPSGGDGPWIWHGLATNTAFAGPWGISFAANLTPDDETGLGRWTPETFIAAMRTGRHQGRGRPILPPMPASAYGQATDEDLLAIYAYLRSLEPVSNRVPQPVDPPAAPAR